MDNCNKNDDSPSCSNIDSLIEKFRFEIIKKSDEDLLNIKKLTIKASNKSRESSLSNRDIDKKISDLECLILRLQDELNDLSNASKPIDECKQKDECEVDYCCPVINECEDPCPEEPEVCSQDNTEYENCDIEEDTACNEIDENIQENENVTRTSSHRYPIILRDIGHVQEEGDDDEKLFNETILINNEKPAEDDQENITNIREAMFYDWKNNERKDEVKEENKPNNDTETITTMIAELRADIDKKIHTLNDEN